MINQAFKQWGINKKHCCPKIAAVYECINQKQVISVVSNMTIQILVQDIRNKASNDQSNFQWFKQDFGGDQWLLCDIINKFLRHPSGCRKQLLQQQDLTTKINK